MSNTQNSLDTPIFKSQNSGRINKYPLYCVSYTKRILPLLDFIIFVEISILKKHDNIIDDQSWRWLTAEHPVYLNVSVKMIIDAMHEKIEYFVIQISPRKYIH